MKAFKPVCLILASTISYSAAATEYEFVAADNTLGTRLCMSAVTDDVKKLKNLAHRIERNTTFLNQKLKVIARHQNCNDVNIVKFANNYGAQETTQLMAKFLTRNVTIRRDTAMNSDNKDKKQGKKVIVISGS